MEIALQPKRPSLTRYAWLSIATAIATILLKGIAWKMTGSIGLLSDAIESVVNLAGAMMALWMLTVAALPADDDHAVCDGLNVLCLGFLKHLRQASKIGLRAHFFGQLSS